MNEKPLNNDLGKIGGAFADGLTLVRVALTPIIMFVIIKGWPGLDMAVLASILFLIAALTDIFDDMIGGGEKSKDRALGWFDDIADTALITGTLAAMLWALYAADAATWVFAVPAGIIIARDVMIGLVKGRAFKTTGWPETKFGSVKTFVSMLAVCTMVASPWLSSWIGSMSGSSDAVTGVYSAPWVGQAGLALLWIAALFSLYTGFQLLTGRGKAANDA
ncbi:MAG: CDP-alcohol phosphatidyltransferase family protein [Alphaproteobacteria bacterium]